MIMNNPLKSVCEKYNINFSSAKNVVQIFKKEGRLEKKVVRARKTKKSSVSKDDLDLSQDDILSAKLNNPLASRSKVAIKNSSPAILLKLMDDDNYSLI
jgi:hypothetical protein